MTLRVAVVLCGVADLQGGGGAERYFADLVAAIANSPRTGVDITLCTDAASVRALGLVGRSLSERQLLVWGGGRVAQLRAMRRDLGLARFDVVHLVQALPRYLPWLWCLAPVPRARRPAVALNVNDSRLAVALERGRGAAAIGAVELLAYRGFFLAPALDGLMSWYERFAAAYERRYRAGRKLVGVARHCFVDTARFHPDVVKQPWGVFAGRLVDYKRPLLFVESVARARDIDALALADWRFFVFGEGPLRAALLASIRALGLQDIVSPGEGGALRDTLMKSSLFVSTQDNENFTSLAMLEAMACGNAVIARDVGQTRAFVRPGCNGLLSADDEVETMARTLVEFCRRPAEHVRWREESRRITLEEHCVARVVDEFAAFWAALDARRRAASQRG